MIQALRGLFPFLEWGSRYSRQTLLSDATAAVIVTIMLIPQSLAYAMLAGLPPEVGLYASILPLVLYAVFGTSRTLAVGPVAVVSLMSAAAVGSVAAQGSAGFIEAAILLALLSGGCLLLMGILRLGFLANFLSHPVISGFISASGILIAVSQVRHILGVPAGGHNLLQVASSLIAGLDEANVPTAAIGVTSLAFLYFVRLRLGSVLEMLHMPAGIASFVVKTGPVFAVVGTTLATAFWALDVKGVAIVGQVSVGLPSLGLPGVNLDLVKQLLLPAFLISLIGFVESVSVAQTLAAKKRQRIDPNQELIALGSANLASGLSGGYAVTGGFARSVVNFDAGAETPAAGMFTAVGIGFATLFLTPLIHYLPKATLAATIIVAVLALIDTRMMRETWRYSKRDFLAMAVTILLTLGVSVEAGVASGVLLSVLLHLYRSSKPHCAIVGRVPGTEHFRNVLRHKVETCPSVVTLRIDESLYFANARFLEDQVYALIADRPELKHLILMCPAVNEIDASALESLEAINHRLSDAGVQFHLSEVKGPVMDRLERSDFLVELSGQVFLSQHQAYEMLVRQNS
ncbi:SulP family inorganic anion transporter [Kordiimonas sp.]|uniref:SulP family inorganic anion transporter n=1 Tax=Kordiimonas sp. TaxID=1970157 RepID=UPI003A9526E3